MNRLKIEGLMEDGNSYQISISWFDEETKTHWELRGYAYTCQEEAWEAIDRFKEKMDIVTPGQNNRPQDGLTVHAEAEK